MLSSLFSGDTSTLEWRSLLICIAASLLLGILVAAIDQKESQWRGLQTPSPDALC